MAYSLAWLLQVLQDAGLKVAPVDGWDGRGNGDVRATVGVICHHTAGPRNGNMPSLNTLLNGRPDLPGPLAQLGLGRDGTFYIIAAGKCNHAGQGSWQGVTTGNSSFIGIEAENTGLSDNTPWPDVQMDAYRRGVAAILKRIGKTADFVAGHKEYALPAGRKDDPDFDMVAFRSGVEAILAGTAPAPTLIPAIEPAAQPAVSAARPTLRRPSSRCRQKLELLSTATSEQKPRLQCARSNSLMGWSPMALSGQKPGLRSILCQLRFRDALNKWLGSCCNSIQVSLGCLLSL